MAATSAFLGNVNLLIKVNGVMRTSINTEFTAGAFNRIYDNDAVITFVNSFCFTICDTWSIIAMIT
jgi:hypothetical protein